MQRVAHLVRDGKDVARRLLVVEQDVRVYAVGARAVCAAALARRLAHVHPAFGKPLAQESAVFLAERRKPAHDQLARVLVGELELRVFDERRVDVVHMLLFISQNALAQGDIAVHIRQIFMHGGDQVLIDADGDVLPFQRALQTGIVAAGAGQEHVLFDVAEIGRRDRVGQVDIGLIILRKRTAAKVAVLAVQKDAVHSVRERDAAARPVLDLAEADIRVVDHRKDILKLRIDLAALREQLFLRRGQDVLFAADEAAQIIILIAQAFIL